MTTSIINNQDNQTPNVSQGSSDAGNGLMKISAGPAALAQLLIYQIMALYAKIIEMDQQQKINMTKAQSAAAQGNAEATVAGGTDMEWMYATMGALGIAGAATGIIAQEVSENIGSIKKAKIDQGEALEKLTPIKDFDATLKTKAAQGQAGDVDEVVSDGVHSRMKEFMNHDYTNVKSKSTVQADIDKHNAEVEEAVGRMKKKGDERPYNVDGSKNPNHFDYENWRIDVRENLTVASRDYNSAVQHTSSKLQSVNNIHQIVTQVSNSTQNIVQGVQTPKKAQHDAAAALSQTTTQMAGSAAADFGQGANKAYEAQNAEIQVLENINRTNSVNG